MRRSISSRLVWLCANRANVMNGTFLATILALGTSHSVYGQCPPEEPPLAPYTETFETVPQPGTGPMVSPLSNCWTLSPVSSASCCSSPGWRIDQGTTPTASSGPSVDNTLGTSAGGYAYFESSGVVSTTPYYLETVDISLDRKSVV